MNAPPIVLALVAAAVAAPAQSLESRGPLAGAATAVLVDNGLVPGTDAETRVHRNGFSLAPTAPLPAAANGPNLQAILATFGALPGLDVDDISLGRDDVLVTGGVIDVPPSSWGVLSFSVTQAATGANNSAIQQEALLGSVGAALFSWILPGSAQPGVLIGRTQRSHSRAELGLPLAGPMEVDAIDFPLMLGRNQATLSGLEPGFAALSGTFEEIYFTVSSATLGAVPLWWWGAVPASGANVLRVRKLGVTWGPPVVFRSYSSLGLAQGEDIDGLAYDSVRNLLLYSVTGTVRDQFLFGDLSTDAAIPIPVTSAGQPISQQVGKAVNDDIDAICTLDPARGTSGGPPPGGDDFGSSCGSYSPGLLGVPSVHASAYRRFNGVVQFDTWMVGWPPVTGIAPGFAVLFVTLGIDPTLIPVGPIHVRDTSPVVPGDPRSYSLVVPPAFALSNTSLTFRWVALDAAVTEIAEAWPVQVNL